MAASRARLDAALLAVGLLCGALAGCGEDRPTTQLARILPPGEPPAPPPPPPAIPEPPADPNAPVVLKPPPGADERPFPNLATVPARPTDIPTQAEIDAERKELARERRAPPPQPAEPAAPGPAP